MIKEKRNFLWQTALSILDVGSSVVYYLLGRDLDTNDIQLLEELFHHVQLTPVSDIHSATYSKAQRQFEENNSLKFIRLLSKLKKGKDILLVTSNSNGYNILQTSISNVLVFSAKALLTYNHLPTEIQANYEASVNARLKLIKALLDYGCDPNRGLVLANKRKLTLSDNQNIHHNEEIECQASEKDAGERPEYADSDSSDSIMPTNIKNVTLNPVTAENLDILNSTPIDTPLLLVCCLYNCHNLLNLVKEKKSDCGKSLSNNFNSQSLPIRSEILSTEQLVFNTEDVKQKQNIFCNNKLQDRSKQNQSSRNHNKKDYKNLAVSLNRKISPKNKCWSSTGNTLTNSSFSEGSSVGFSDCSSFNYADDHEVVQSDFTYLTEEVVYKHEPFESEECIYRKPVTQNSKEAEDVIPNFDSSEEQENLDVEIDLDLVSSSGSSTNSTTTSEKTSINSDFDSQLKDIDYSTNNIYNYENDDDGHYDRYELDMNFSSGFKIHPNHQVYANITSPTKPTVINQLGHFYKSINSMSSLVSNHGSSVTKTTPTGKLRQELANAVNHMSNYHLSEVREKYKTLNAQRLELVDLLLKYDADKYLVAKLSTSSYQTLNRKSQNILKRWYELPSRYPIHKRLCNVDLRPVSPIMVSLCLDDVEVFSRLYKHHRTLYRYFKPNEDLELIYYAVRFQAENCLIYLLSNLASRNGMKMDCLLSNDFSVHTMFYILENTRSAKIISVLIKCGFDLTRSDEQTGNTSLHCLFNEANTTCFDRCVSKSNEKCSFKSDEFFQGLPSRKALDEFQTPKNLSNILFTLLKYGGLKPYVNATNNDHKHCMQLLFEWSQLIDIACFINTDKTKNKEWQTELESCISLLLKSGADIFLNVSKTDSKKTDSSFNCVDTLIKSILLQSAAETSSRGHDNYKHHNALSTTDYPETETTSSNHSSFSLFTATKRVYLAARREKKHLDVAYVLHLLNEVLDLETLLKIGVKKRHNRRSYTHKTYRNPQTVNYSVYPVEDDDSNKYYNSLIGNYLKTLMNSHVTDFEAAFNLLKLLCKFEKELASDLIVVVDPNLIRKFINAWIMQPSFLSSSNQFEKNYFVKSCLVHLITSKLCDPNDCFTYYNDKSQLVSNNLLNHCVQLVGLCKSGYQLEVIYDLTRTLIQYGADPNLDPYELKTENGLNFQETGCSHQRLKRNWSILTHLCKSVQINSNDPSIINDLVTRQGDELLEFMSLPVAKDSNCYLSTPIVNLVNQCQQKQTKNRLKRSSTCLGTPDPTTPSEPISNYFNDYFNEKYTSTSTDIAHELDITQRKNSTRSHSSIMLLTPTPSYDRCISAGYYQNLSSNIVVDSRVLLLNYYKNFIKLFYDSMDTYSIFMCLEYSSNRQDEYIHNNQSHHNHHHHNHNHHHHHHHHHHSKHHSRHHNSQINNSLKENRLFDTHSSSIGVYQSHGYHSSHKSHAEFTLEPLGEYLQHLASSPRTLKSITRRQILSLLVQNDTSESGEAEGECGTGRTTLIANQIHQLTLPKKLKDFLLFIE